MVSVDDSRLAFGRALDLTMKFNHIKAGPEFKKSSRYKKYLKSDIYNAT